MELTLIRIGTETVRAGYVCPCGCTPSVEYARGAEVATEGCCCGNQFAVGPDAAGTLAVSGGFRAEVQGFDAAWGERLEAAWLVGPSVHRPAEEHSHDHEPATDGTSATDPVCGMTIEPEAARSKGLYAAHGGIEYFFCGKGCRLEFEDDPEHYLDPTHRPSM